MDTGGELIVVVEDDAGMREALQRLLGASGYRASAFPSAEALASAGLPAGAACLVLDVHLPGRSGMEFYAALAAPRPPAVFITARDNRENREAAARESPCALLPKPFTGAALLDFVAAALRRGPAP